MRGDMQGGAALLETVFDRYGERLTPLWKADYLAMLALFESAFDDPNGQTHIEEAIRFNRATCGPLSQLYLLTVRTAVLSRFDTAAAIETAEELGRLDRTPRRA